MRAYVGVTDNEWYRFLAARPGLSQYLRITNFSRWSSARPRPPPTLPLF